MICFSGFVIYKIATFPETRCSVSCSLLAKVGNLNIMSQVLDGIKCFKSSVFICIIYVIPFPKYSCVVRPSTN